jgi:hypothetical protein
MKSCQKTSDPSTPIVSFLKENTSGRRPDGCISIYPNGSADLAYIHRSEVPSLSLDLIRQTRGIEVRVARAMNVSRSMVSQVARGRKKSARISAALAAEIERINQQFLSGNGARALETRPRETKAQPATASPETTDCGANGEDSKPAPDRRPDSPSSSKARIRLHCKLACNNGDVYASYDGLHVVTKIGRDEELSKTFPPSKFIYPRGPLVPIDLWAEALRADRAAKKQGAKPRIVLRCMDTPSFSSTFGVTLATAPGVGAAIEIGRPHAEAVS